MKKLTLCLLLIPFFVCSFHTKKGSEQSLFWKISGNGLKQPSYIFGTIHLMDERIFSFDSIVYEKIDACEALSGELLFEGIGAQINPEDLFMDDTLLSELYDNEEDYIKVSGYLRDNLGIFSMACDSMKPIYTSSMIAMMDSKMDMSVPLDAHFQNYARSRGKLILGIETMEEQMVALNSISLKDQATMLLESVMLEDSVDIESMTELLIQTYLAQDLVKLDSLLETGTSVENFQQKILMDRNDVMAVRIEEFIKDRSTFNTLGAGHLKGKNGVINYLRDKGYKVEPIIISFNKK